MPPVEEENNTLRTPTRLTMEAVVGALHKEGLISEKQGKFALERRSIQEAKIGAHRSQAEARDPITVLLSLEFSPPNRPDQPPAPGSS